MGLFGQYLDCLPEYLNSYSLNTTNHPRYFVLGQMIRPYRKQDNATFYPPRVVF